MINEEKISKKVGNNIKQYREKKEYTQKELAEKIKVKQPTIAKWETGDREPSIENIKKILETLNITFEQLIK